jgi:hypothetical protein
MSFLRLVYYGALLGGWAAFIGWLAAETLLLPRDGPPGVFVVALVGAVVGAAIGAGLGASSGLVSGAWPEVARRALVGGPIGLVGGLAGTLIAETAYQVIGIPRAIGWMLMGTFVGLTEGIYERSWPKLRNGLIGGAIGGLLGGLLFGPIQSAFANGSGTTSRATAFVILGLCVGAAVGLVQVILRQTWITVLDGYRPGRQLILSQPEIALGTAESCGLLFVGIGSKGIEPKHVFLKRQADGGYTLEDNRTRIGTKVNDQLLAAAVRLKDGDVIKLGVNALRFNQRHMREAPTLSTPSAKPALRVSPSPQPPPTRSPQPTAPPTARPAPRLPTPRPPTASPISPPPAPPRSTAPPTSPPTSAPTTGGQAWWADAAAAGHSGTKNNSKKPAPPPAEKGADVCPGCKRPVPAAGSSGKRYCLICDKVF